MNNSREILNRARAYIKEQQLQGNSNIKILLTEDELNILAVHAVYPASSSSNSKEVRLFGYKVEVIDKDFTQGHS